MKTNDDWKPLESNPKVLNKYIKKLGFDTSKYHLVDVLSTDDWAADMIPKPCKAVVFLFPCN